LCPETNERTYPKITNYNPFAYPGMLMKNKSFIKYYKYLYNTYWIKEEVYR
jgi:hypothetical protein